MHILSHIAGIIFGALCAGGAWLVGAPLIAVLPVFAIAGHGLILFLDYSIEAIRDRDFTPRHPAPAQSHGLRVVDADEWLQAA